MIGDEIAWHGSVVCETGDTVAELMDAVRRAFVIDPSLELVIRYYSTHTRPLRTLPKTLVFELHYEDFYDDDSYSNDSWDREEQERNDISEPSDNDNHQNNA